MRLFFVYHVLLASGDCQNVLAVHFSSSVLDKSANVINFASNANNAVPMYDIKISTGCLPPICAMNRLIGANKFITRVNTTRRLTTTLIKAILEMMEMSEMHVMMPNLTLVVFTIDLSP